MVSTCSPWANMQKSPWWPLHPTYGYGVKGHKKGSGKVRVIAMTQLYLVYFCLYHISSDWAIVNLFNWTPETETNLHFTQVSGSTLALRAKNACLQGSHFVCVCGVGRMVVVVCVGGSVGMFKMRFVWWSLGLGMGVLEWWWVCVCGCGWVGEWVLVK